RTVRVFADGGELVAQRPLGNAEAGGGAGAPAAAFGERAANRFRFAAPNRVGKVGFPARRREAEIRRRDRAVVGENGRALEAVRKLAHVAGPAVPFERGKRVAGEGRNRVAGRPGRAFQEVGGKRQDVERSLGERQQTNGEDREAPEQV